MVVPDVWIEAGSQKEQYEIAGIDTPHIVAKVQAVVDMLKQHRY